MKTAKIIHTETISDSRALETALAYFRFAAALAESDDIDRITNDGDPWPEILMEDRNGRQITQAQLIQVTLTDGSTVFNIRFV